MPTENPKPDPGDATDQRRPRRRPRQNWMVAANPVILLTPSGPTEVSPAENTGQLVGWKAFGLTCLPQAWTPPFFVIGASCLGDTVTDPQVAQWISQVLAQKGFPADRYVIVRSSGTAETMIHRGRLYSETCRSGDVLKTIRDLLGRPAEFRDGELHWIIQEAISPVSKGHLSNERHVSREGRDWLAQIEYLDDRGDSTARIAVRLWRDGTMPAVRDLHCNSETEVTLALKRVAIWTSQYSSRTHFEWVWNGRAISIVQADKEEPPAGTKPRDLVPQEIPTIQVATLRAFRPANDRDYRAYRKLNNAYTYAELGYTMPKFFVLDDQGVIGDLFNGIVRPDLMDDLAELTKRPLVIRTDGANIPQEQYEMLPRTEDIRSAEVARAWLTGEFVTAIRDAKLVDASLCFIAHHFIPSVAAAWARAEPKTRMVRIESLWGLPEGLYWFAHDTFEVDTRDTQIEPDRAKAIRRYLLGEHLRFKGTFIAPDMTGKWIPHQTRRPHDWGRSVTKRAWLFEIAHTTRRIAERLQYPVAVMWFIDNHPQATKHKVLPWFHLRSELTGSPNPSPRNKRRGATNFTITTKESWLELQQRLAMGNRIERVVVQPTDPELIRNRSFTEGLARLAGTKQFVVVLSGGILSHAYYVLQREGAPIECVDLFGVNEEVIEFNKLVRDHIPELIRQGGERVTTVELRGDALIAALRRKLVEEAYEALDAPTGGELVGELADVLEVIRALARHLHVTPAELSAERVAKFASRGGFRDGVMLKTTAAQRSLQPATRGQQLPGLEGQTEDKTREIITDVADLPKAGFYRRPDLRQLDQAIVEKLFTFETSLAELPGSQRISEKFSFSLPVERSGEREFVLTIEFERKKSTLRGVIRLQPEGGRRSPDGNDDEQLRLDLGDPL